MEDSCLTQPWLFEVLEGENISFLCWTIFICIPSEISWEIGSPLLRRCFMRGECIAGICTGLARGGKKALLASAGRVRCIGGQNWWPESVWLELVAELVARIIGQNWWLVLVARTCGQNMCIESVARIGG